MTATAAPAGGSLRGLPRPFLLLVAVQTLALGGNALTAFALGVWIYQAEGRALPFAWLQVVSTLPLVGVLPWAGSVADRCDRRRVVLFAAGVALGATLALAALLAAGALAVWQVYAFAFVGAVAGAFQRPAFGALAAALLPPARVTQGSGLLGLSHEVVGLAAPLVAGALTARAGLAGAVSLDLLLYAVAIGLLMRLFPALALAARAPAPETASGGRAAPGSHDLRDTWAYLRARPPMVGLTGYVVLQGALVSLVAMLAAPLVLGRFDSTALGLVMTLGGLGGALGSGALVLLGPRRRLMASLLAADAVLSLAVLLAGLSTSLAALCACAVVAFAAAGLAHGFASALWILKVPDARRGRVYAFTGTVALVVGPLVAAGGALLADLVFEPAWRGHGMAAVFVLSGSGGLLLALGGLVRAGFRRLDDRLPDA